MQAREQAERELRQTEARLAQAQKMETAGRLTAGVAHDFNNLLLIVRVNAELLRGQAGDGPQATRLDTICKAVDRGAGLTRQLLAFSRQQLLSPRAFDPNAVLRDISELIRTSLGDRVRLDLRCDPACWPAYADAAQVEQVILNLAINARDAIAGDGLPPGDRLAVLVVEDDVPVRGATASLLRRAGFRVVEARDATEALRLARANAVQVVLTDQAMPGMTGTELARALRRGGPSRPIVFMTGHTDPDLCKPSAG